jgi:hypothetical protein
MNMIPRGAIPKPQSLEETEENAGFFAEDPPPYWAIWLPPTIS